MKFFSAKKNSFSKNLDFLENHTKGFVTYRQGFVCNKYILTCGTHVRSSVDYGTCMVYLWVACACESISVLSLRTGAGP